MPAGSLTQMSKNFCGLVVFSTPICRVNQCEGERPPLKPVLSGDSRQKVLGERR